MENPRCPKCGTELTAGSPEKLCPRCLLLAGLESQAKPLSPPTSAYSPGFAAPTPEELSRFFPQLEILELLGRGGMGAVYKARQPGLDRLVALKILPPESGSDTAFSERFTREARALAKLNHPNIVGVFDFGQSNGLYYFVMEYVDGVNLRQAMRAGDLKAEEALKIVPQICEALQFAHDEGVVHRDIKPENILLDKRGRVKIADFGLAKLLGAKDVRGLTATQQVMGTPHYMAPEQIQGTRDVDHRADIYSLGVTFYEMLTGELPLGRFAPPSTKVQIDVRLDEVVLRTLEVEPEKRYQHASEVKTQLEEIGGVTAGALLRAFGKEYRSTATIFGVPLLHIAFGFDPRTGRKRMAKGIFAFGDIAFGAFAFGGLAMGGVCFGGLSLGLVSMAGVALGLVGALGGVAIGTFAFGGLALGGVALGGMVVGYYAYGGSGWAMHGMLGGHADPDAMAFFHPWAHQWSQWLVWLSLAFPAAGLLLYAFIWYVFRFVAPAQGTPASRTKGGAAGTSIAGGTEKLSSPEGWLALPSRQRALIKRFLLVVLVVGVCMFVSFSHAITPTPLEGKGTRTVTTFTIGAFDPWFTHEQREDFFVGGKFGGFSLTDQVHWLSGSMGCGVLALLAIYGFMAIRRLEKSQLPPPAPAQSIADFRWAGAWLLASGLLSLISFAPYFLAMAVSLRMPDATQVVLVSLASFEFWVGLIRGILIIRGANAAREFRNLGRVQLAGVVALIPISLAWLVTFPIGIWIWRLLSRPDVLEAFEKNNRLGKV